MKIHCVYYFNKAHLHWRCSKVSLISVALRSPPLYQPLFKSQTFTRPYCKANIIRDKLGRTIWTSNPTRKDFWSSLSLPDVKSVSIYLVGQEIRWISGCVLSLQYCIKMIKINFLQHFPLNINKQPAPLKRMLHCEGKCINQNQSTVLSIKHLHLTFQSVAHIQYDVLSGGVVAPFQWKISVDGTPTEHVFYTVGLTSFKSDIWFLCPITSGQRTFIGVCVCAFIYVCVCVCLFPD